jgi:NADH dehydrogenase FAD-containing subunit
VAPRFDGLLTGLNFVQGAATAVDLDNRKVTIESPTLAAPLTPDSAAAATMKVAADATAAEATAAGPESGGSATSLPFDRLIVAVGSEAADLGNVPGAAEHALPFYTLEHAEELQVIKEEALFFFLE